MHTQKCCAILLLTIPGAAFWGILVDIIGSSRFALVPAVYQRALLIAAIGRQWAFNLTVLFSSVFGLALAGSQNYETFLVLTAFVGFGVGGNIPIDTTITLEFIPQVCQVQLDEAQLH